MTGGEKDAHEQTEDLKAGNVETESDETESGKTELQDFPRQSPADFRACESEAWKEVVNRSPGRRRGLYFSNFGEIGKIFSSKCVDNLFL